MSIAAAIAAGVSVAQFFKKIHDDKIAEQNAANKQPSTPGLSIPTLDTSGWDGEQSGYQPMQQAPVAPQLSTQSPYYQPNIGGDIDTRLQQLRLMEASRGMQPMPTQPSLAPMGYGQTYGRGY